MGKTAIVEGIAQRIVNDECRVRISDEAIVAAAELSDRYIRDRFLPDKAIDLIDQERATSSMRASCSCRWSGSFPHPTSASPSPWRRSSAS